MGSKPEPCESRKRREKTLVLSLWASQTCDRSHSALFGRFSQGVSLLKKSLSGRSADQKRIQHRQTKAKTLRKKGLGVLDLGSKGGIVEFFNTLGSSRKPSFRCMGSSETDFRCIALYDEKNEEEKNEPENYE